MLISKEEFYVEVHAILEEGIDFSLNDIVPDELSGGKLKILSSEARNKVAFQNGYRSTSWSGFYNPESHTVECSFKNPLFVDKTNNTFKLR